MSATVLSGEDRRQASGAGAAGQVGFAMFLLGIGVVLAWAWHLRQARYLVADTGIGYALGIVGASLMLLLLLYPLRKRVAFASHISLAAWFRFHMTLGVLGPLCIILHSNFRLGSTNSSVALAAMLLVAGSGLVGRYLYGRFHHGLYGEQVKLRELRCELEAWRTSVQALDMDPDERAVLEEGYDQVVSIIEAQRGEVSLRQILRHRRQLRCVGRSVATLGRMDAEARPHLAALVALLRRLGALRLCERLFSLWHVAHIPIFFLMLVTATVHVVVVHWF